MKQLLELMPIVLFFVVYQLDGKQIDIAGLHYQFDGIFTATQVLIAATLLQVAVTRIVIGKVEKRLLWLLAAVCVFGGATLVFRNELFIQWKPTIFNWVLALVFGASQFIGHSNLMERTLGTQIKLPKKVWTRLNVLWVINFLVVGALNLFVAYNFSEQTWVSYKLYSAIGFTVLLAVLTVVMITPYIKEDAEQSQRQ